VEAGGFVAGLIFGASDLVPVFGLSADFCTEDFGVV
jgi:hypothetical protein